MTTSPKILAQQAAYQARPFAVRWRDSHCSCTNRFNSYDEAFDYIQQMWIMIRKTVRNNRYHASYLWQCSLVTPAGETSLDYVLLCADVSSY